MGQTHENRPRQGLPRLPREPRPHRRARDSQGDLVPGETRLPRLARRWPPAHRRRDHRRERQAVFQTHLRQVLRHETGRRLRGADHGHGQRDRGQRGQGRHAQPRCDPRRPARQGGGEAGGHRPLQRHISQELPEVGYSNRPRDGLPPQKSRGALRHRP